MRIEQLIYLYGAVCVSMIVFQCACIYVFREREVRRGRQSLVLEEKIREQLRRLADGFGVEKAHFHFLSRKLSRPGNLMAFHDALRALGKEEGELLSDYLISMEPVCLDLARVYLRREPVQGAYYAYLMSRCPVGHRAEEEGDILLEYLKKDSLYCRQNAMKALYHLGKEEYVLRAVRLLGQQKLFFHGKILTDGLLTFEGSHERLIAQFWEHLAEYPVEDQVAVLNYIRFQSGAYAKEMQALLEDAAQNAELHYAAIRYFGKYPCAAVLPRLLAYASDRDPLRWSYAAFAATALAGYPGEETLRILKGALSHPNWYVRYNAAQSLELLQVGYEEVADVLNGSDRYAKEMLEYWLESGRRTREGAQASG